MSHLKESESDVRCYKDDNGIDIVEFIDNSGNILTTMNINGNSFPHYKADIHGDAFHPDLLKHIPNIKLREDDVIICSFPKSDNFGCWFDYVMYWEEVIKNRLDGNEILQLNYEQLQKNPHNEVKRLAHFLGVELDERLLHDVIKSCCFRQMEERNCADEPHLYRKGKVGDWKNWFTVAENEQFDLVLSQKMANSDLSFTYS
ncbi:hypothetical protein LOTGIDRAFT_159689 [Lottia gigantea]|uniref:Sulfotransferase domain-containing protein n=1 Tax=Lottia gigantea TaxID=225164 RepID=V4C5Q4_LOTGI|nr:hypothetical protein LOTGIDRAFT_159689 [Lottia gigantea]ESO96934.1 hypothetical protein LOTGIDRAFT_159689 [Lottia gigantea]